MNNKTIYNTVESALNKAELSYEVQNDMIFTFAIKGEHSNYDVRLICEEELEMLVSIVMCSMCVPHDKIDKMCRWIVEKNYNTFLGEFKLDVSDGELSFRIACSLDNGAINEDIVNVAISNALSTFDKSYEEIVKTIYLDNGSGGD